MKGHGFPNPMKSVPADNFRCCMTTVVFDHNVQVYQLCCTSTETTTKAIPARLVSKCQLQRLAEAGREKHRSLSLKPPFNKPFKKSQMYFVIKCGGGGGNVNHNSKAFAFSRL